VADDLEDVEDILGAIIEDAERAVAGRLADGDVAGRLTDRLLVNAGVVAYPRRIGRMRTAALDPSVDRSTEQYRYLRSLVARALGLEAEIARDHVRGTGSAPYHRLFNPNGARQGSEEARTLRELISEYRAEREAVRGKESTDRKYGLLFRVLEEVLGPDTTVPSIGRAQCVEVLNFLRRLPPNATKRFPRLSLTQAVAKAEAEGLKGLSSNTVASYMQNLAAVLRWGEDNGWGASAKTRGLVTSRKPEVRRRGFEPDELKGLFDGLRHFRETEPTKYWVPALALFTGARAGEICQLRTEDVTSIKGIWCLNLSEFDADGERVEDKRLKTPTSERYVPLHPDLIEAGLLAFVGAQDPRGRLFPDLTPGPKESYSHGFSKWFGRWKKTVGFDQRSLVFHSFRHGFRDACRHADIAEETALALGGWAGINQATRYGDRAMVPVLDRAMQKIAFGGFKLP
jgi:integrase